MLTVFAVVVLCACAMAAAVDARRADGARVSTLFIITSVVFINVGMLVRWLNAAGPGQQQYDGALLVSACGLLSFTIGSLLGSSRRAPRSLRNHEGFRRLRGMASNPNLGTINLTLKSRELLLTSIVVLAIASSYFVLLGSIPLLSGLGQLVSGGRITAGLVNEYRIGRDIYVNPEAAYIPMQGLLEAFRYYGLPVVLVWMDALRRHGCMRRTSIVIMILSVFLIIGSGQRWPLMYAVLAMVVARLATGTTEIRGMRKILGAAAGGAVVLSALLGRGASGIDNPLQATVFGIRDLISRLLLSQSGVPFASYQFPRASLLPEFSSTWAQNLMALMPGPAPSYPVTLSQVVTGNATGFSAPPDFYTETWINLGWTGVVLVAFCWGVALGRIRLRPQHPLPLVYLGYRSVAVTVCAFSAFAGLSVILTIIVVGCLIEVSRLGCHTLVRGGVTRSARRTPSLLAP